MSILGVVAKLGAPGDDNNYSEAQSWGVMVACALTALALARLGWRLPTPKDQPGFVRPEERGPDMRARVS